ncbi:uncharacterized protein LOC127279856 isoform X2 [Leptopilina boulardi]|nr:uncharacterized protein LOC127279856 isoform X2 [Leptopilina boulardi]
MLSSMTSAAFFGARKPQEKRDRNSLEKTLLNTTLPVAADPPRLIAIGDPRKGGLKTHIYVDQKAMYTGPVVEALTQIVALYYVFHIAPSTDLRAAFSFIFGILMQEAAQKEYKR